MPSPAVTSPNRAIKSNDEGLLAIIIDGAPWKHSSSSQDKVPGTPGSHQRLGNATSRKETQGELEVCGQADGGIDVYSSPQDLALR